MLKADWRTKADRRKRKGEPVLSLESEADVGGPVLSPESEEGVPVLSPESEAGEPVLKLSSVAGNSG